jgi:FkbM family methyltransferase
VALVLARSSGTVVEIGANEGTETVGYSDIVGPNGRVIAFEPLPANQRALARNVELLRYANVHILPYALGETSGTMRFAAPPEGASSGIGHLLGPEERRSGAVTYYGGVIPSQVIDVTCRTLDSFGEELADASLVAADIEGAELAMLRGGEEFLRRASPAIVVEASPTHQERAGADLGLLHAELRKLDYVVFEIGRLGIREVTEPDAARQELGLPSRLQGASVCGRATFDPAVCAHPLSRAPESAGRTAQARIGSTGSPCPSVVASAALSQAPNDCREHREGGHPHAGRNEKAGKHVAGIVVLKAHHTVGEEQQPDRRQLARQAAPAPRRHHDGGDDERESSGGMSAGPRSRSDLVLAKPVRVPHWLRHVGQDLARQGRGHQDRGGHHRVARAAAAQGEANEARGEQCVRHGIGRKQERLSDRVKDV